MLRLTIAFVALLAIGAVDASAQETYSIPVTAGQQSTVDGERLTFNAAVCASTGLPATCTQAEHVAAGGVGTIYPNTTNGRRNFIVDQWLRDNLRNAKARQAASAHEKVCVWWNDPARTQAEKDARCTSFNLPAGCELCN